jgi:hypothetical protein
MKGRFDDSDMGIMSREKMNLHNFLHSLFSFLVYATLRRVDLLRTSSCYGTSHVDLIS